MRQVLLRVGATVVVLAAVAALAAAQTPRGRNLLRPLFPSASCSSFSPGTEHYQADWSNGLDDWRGHAGWSADNGMLVWDGSETDAIIYAPEPPSTPDYAVEAEIQILGDAGDGFALFVRQLIHFEQLALIEDSTATIALGGRFYRPFANAGFNPGIEWHTYRFEARERELRLMVDGACLLEVEGGTGHTNTGAYPTGIWAGQTPLNVRSFKIIGE